MNIEIKGYLKRPLSITQNVVASAGTNNITYTKQRESDVWLIRKCGFVNITSGGAGLTFELYKNVNGIDRYFRRYLNLTQLTVLNYDEYIWLYGNDKVIFRQLACNAGDQLQSYIDGFEFIANK